MLLASFFKRAISHLNQLTRLQLEFIYRLTMRSPAMIAAASCLLLLLSSIIIAKTSFEADIFRLFPRKLPALQLLLESLEWTGGAKEAYFLLEGDRELLPVEAGKLVNRLQQMQLDGKPAFSRITWRVYDESEGELFTDFIAFAGSNPQRFISTADIPKLSEKLSKSSIKASVIRTIKSEISANLWISHPLLQPHDPLFFRDLILPRLKAASQSMKLDSTSPYLMSKDGQVMIVVAEPARAVQDIEFARRLVSGINDARRGLKVSVSCAGAHMSAVLDEAEMKTNILSCILSSLVVVLLIFYAVYRRDCCPTLLLPLIIAVGCDTGSSHGLHYLLPSIHIISFAFRL
jgi:predicted RND superfamily exporter protein